MRVRPCRRGPRSARATRAPFRREIREAPTHRKERARNAAQSSPAGAVGWVGEGDLILLRCGQQAPLLRHVHLSVEPGNRYERDPVQCRQHLGPDPDIE